jgi:hypothetical protein
MVSSNRVKSLKWIMRKVREKGIKKFQPRKDSVNMADDQSQSPTGGECRDDTTIDYNASCHRDLSVPSYFSSSQQQQQQEIIDEVASSSSSRRDTSLRSLSTISKDMIRTFQTTVQGNTRSERMISSDSNSRLASSLTSITNTTSIIQPRLQKLASEGSSRIVQQIVGDRGIYSSHVRSWGSNVSAEISSFTSHKVVPLFRRHNTCPSSSEFEQHGNYRWADGISSMGGGGVSSGSSKKDVSFDYQLMKDNE